MPVTIDLAEINFRKGTAAQWTTANPLLIAGEPGLETDTKLIKIGDGVTLWNALGYMPEQIAAQIRLASAKATPVDADEFALVDSAASNVIKKVTWANIKATLLTWLTPLFEKIGGYTTTATSVTPIVLTVSSTRLQVLTGTVAQTITAPDVTTLPYAGYSYTIRNNSTAAAVFNASAGALITSIPAGEEATITCILLTGTTAASWDAKITGFTTTPSGKVVQIVNTQTGTTATGTTVLPNDGTIPQNTEGDQYMSLAITPTSATNILTIQVVAFFGCGVNLGDICTALFQDATASALAAIGLRMQASTSGMSVLTYRMVAGTASATTFKVRIGNGSAGTTVFNPTAYGSIVASSITITESTP